MHASVRAFLNQIIDYAGLFPPAKLPLDEAMRIFLRDRKSSPHRWMLGRFVCPTARLKDLLALAKGHADASLLSVAALGQACTLASELPARIESDRQAIEEFRQAWGQAAVIDMYEVALPRELPAGSARNVTDRMAKSNCCAFLEPARTQHWRNDLGALADEIHLVRNASPSVGLKLRCGGVTAEAFPTDEEVAFFIHRCSAEGLSWKATAGLHHPRRHWDAALQVWHHGFLNVFGAGLLARTNPLTEADIAAILADREATHFRFTEDRICWKDWCCTLAQIAAHRAHGATTFGSCSFAEPCEDLTVMGLI
jgi:hypothetical protein